MVSSGPSDFLMSVLMGLRANCWFIFTMPHCLSQATTKMTRNPLRTAVSTSCG